MSTFLACRNNKRFCGSTGAAYEKSCFTARSIAPGMTAGRAAVRHEISTQTIRTALLTAFPRNVKSQASATDSHEGETASNLQQPAPADPACPKAQVASVAREADVMLNQTNIGEKTTSFTGCNYCKKATMTTGCGPGGGELVTKARLPFKDPMTQTQGTKNSRKSSGAAAHTISGSALCPAYFARSAAPM